eukprot:2600011-Rhodomonas_salina.1
MVKDEEDVKGEEEDDDDDDKPLSNKVVLSALLSSSSSVWVYPDAHAAILRKGRVTVTMTTSRRKKAARKVRHVQWVGAGREREEGVRNAG